MLSEQDRAAGWSLCEPHRNPVHPALGYCGQCAPSESVDEPDYDLMGKYGGSTDRYQDDHGLAVAPGGYGWWKG